MNPKGTQQQEARRMMMLNDPIHRVIPKMAIPTIVAFLINSIYSLADTYFVSSLGTNATAAVSVNASLDQLIMMCGSLLALGANSYIARLMGQGNDKKASQVLSTAFYTAFAIGLLLTVVGCIFMTPMVRLLGATPTCEQYSIEYATYVLLAAPFMATSFVMNQCLRSEGSATLSMVGMGFGGILNCVLDPIFIFGLDMGVSGASLATAISKVVSFGILIFPYITRRSMLHLSVKNICYSRDIVGNVVSVGSSSMFRSGLAVVSAIMLNDLAGNISDSVLAGVGVCTKIMMFPFSIILGFGSGFQPVAGFNWGAKRFDRVQKCFSFSAWTALIGALVMAAVLIIFADPLIVLFAGNDPEMREIGALSIRIQSIALPIHAWVAVVNMLCTGLGNAKGAFLLATARQGTCFIPILYPLAHFFNAYGVASVQGLADVLTLALAIPLAVYMAKRIRRAQQMQLDGVLPEKRLLKEFAIVTGNSPKGQCGRANSMKRKAFIYIVIAGVLWGTSGIFVHYLAPYGFSSLQMTCVRATVSFLCLGGYALLADRSLFRVNFRQLLLCIGTGACIFLTASCYFTSMQMTSVSTAVVLMYTAPVYVTIVSVLFLDEKFSRLKLLSVVCIMVGGILVSGFVTGMKFHLSGILIGVLSGIAYAAYNLLTKLALRQGCRPVSVTVYSFAAMMVIAALVCKPWEIFTYAAEAPVVTVPLLIGMGICTCVMPYFLYTFSMRDLSAGTASALGIVEPMAATVFSVVFFQEKLDLFSGCGIVLILVAVFLLGKAEDMDGAETK